MSSSAHKLPITATEYLEGELRSETRHDSRPWYHLDRIED